MQQLSPIDKAALANRPALIKQLRGIVPEECVIDDDASLRVYETDALTAYRQVPMLVVLPETTAQVAAVLKLCSRLNIKVVPRGAGTSLSGGALPLADGIVLGLGKFNKILDIDFANRCVVAQSGVTNLAITEAVKHKGFYYAPDPSSQIVCTIGGNVSENSGGVHCLKYGLTTNNVMGLEMVTMAGEILRIGGKYLDPAGYDLLGIITGSEGLLGVITEVTVRIIQEPQTARAMLLGFPSNETAGECVARIISSGIIPAGIEMMDEFAIKAAEDFCHAGYPVDCPALVLTELDGPRGRIYLLKNLFEHELTPTKKVVKHIDRCLSCLSCMTTCPSSVNYMHLVDEGRGYIETPTPGQAFSTSARIHPAPPGPTPFAVNPVRVTVTCPATAACAVPQRPEASFPGCAIKDKTTDDKPGQDRQSRRPRSRLCPAGNRRRYQFGQYPSA